MTSETEIACHHTEEAYVGYETLMVHSVKELNTTEVKRWLVFRCKGCGQFRIQLTFETYQYEFLF